MEFDFNFTSDQLSQCIQNQNTADWFDSISKNLINNNITSVLRVAAWLAQIGHESGDFHEIVENLNYSATGLTATWPSLFPPAIASQYQRQPIKIGNRAYGNRMGNGDESSGDGYKFRGRGLIQITGKDNYTACSKFLYNDTRLLDNPDLLAQTDGAVASACWFWSANNLNTYADNSDMLTITKRINGGTIGLDDRMRRYNLCLSVLNSSTAQSTNVDNTNAADTGVVSSITSVLNSI